jgi:hypothetical protein
MSYAGPNETREFATSSIVEVLDNAEGPEPMLVMFDWLCGKLLKTTTCYIYLILLMC